MRRFGILLLVVSATAGCKMNEAKFVEEYVEAECAYALACYDDAVLNFYGWADEAACIEDKGPQIHEDLVGCEFDAAVARACVDAYEELGCPAEGEHPEPPAICRDVTTACVDDTGEHDASDTADEG